MVDVDLEAATVSISEEERIATTQRLSFGHRQTSLTTGYKESAVLAFSPIMERHPGIVVGQIRRKLNRYAYLTKYLVKIRHFVLPVSLADRWGQTVRFT